jgi:hypothetical protein
MTGELGSVELQRLAELGKISTRALAFARALRRWLDVLSSKSS